MRRALQMLSYRSRSSSEITSDLIGKGFDAMVVDTVVRELESKGLVCDALLSREIVAGGQRSGKSRARVYAELRRRGISRDVAEEVLEGSFDPQDECEAAAREMNRMLRSAGGRPRQEEIERAARRLAGRGFSTAAVSHALREAQDVSPVANEEVLYPFPPPHD